MNSHDSEAHRAAAEKALLEKLQLRLDPAAAELIRQEVHAGVASGIAEGFGRILTDENAEKFWSAAISVAKKNATKRAGSWLIGGMGKAASATMWAVVFVIAMWMTFGLNGMVHIVKAIGQARSAA
jgi:hypothetical protein